MRSEAVFLRYQNDAPIFGAAGYYEVLMGGWDSPDYGENFVTLQVGLGFW